jgi:glutamate-ammonia-ligase adenylyltransferase
VKYRSCHRDDVGTFWRVLPRLLRAVAEAPDPDMALLNLEKVTASLGAKTVLWELFSFNPPSRRLYVDLCALSQYLIGSPDQQSGNDRRIARFVGSQPTAYTQRIDSRVKRFIGAATDPEPILHSFQDKELLRLGARGILGKQTIRETTTGLSDLAEAYS